MVFSPCVKFRSNICHSDRDIAIKPIFKMRQPPSWNFSEVKSERKTVFWTLFLVSLPNFVRIMFNNNRVVAVKKNFKMAAAAILDFVKIDYGVWFLVSV